MWPFNRKKKKPEPKMFNEPVDITEILRAKSKIGCYISAGITPSCSKLSGGWSDINYPENKKRYRPTGVDDDGSILSVPIFDPTPYNSYDSFSDSSPSDSGSSDSGDAGGGGSFDGGGNTTDW